MGDVDDLLAEMDIAMGHRQAKQSAEAKTVSYQSYTKVGMPPCGEPPIGGATGFTHARARAVAHRGASTNEPTEQRPSRAQPACVPFPQGAIIIP